MGEREDTGAENVIDTRQMGPDELAMIRAATAEPKAGSLSLLVYSQDGVTAVPLAEGRGVVIGRFAPADITIRDNSLSRQHARVELRGDTAWVEDLDSTNGTWVDGKRIERAKVPPGVQIRFGAVGAAVYANAASTLGIEDHDRFVKALEAEASRARQFDRPLALILVHGDRIDIAAWLPTLREHLRPFDRAALYSAQTIEVLLPELDKSAGCVLCDGLLAGHGSLRCALAELPTHGSTGGELLETARTALQLSSAEHPISVAEPRVTSRALTVPSTTEDGPVAEHPKMRRVLESASRLASSVLPVLILGETGTGKEVVARQVHEAGKRRDRPLIYVNCAAIPEQLVESTLFGHEKGAFTGAHQRTKGVFESADGGTVLLDEIGELPAAAQAALLRVLETKRFSRVGSSEEIEVDVRVVAATHRDLEEMCGSGAFRRDLLYRLNAATIEVPPLRERVADIGPLVHRFIAEANRANERTVSGITQDAVERLRAYPWPGNVRELKNAIERAVVIAPEDVITAEDLPRSVTAASGAPVPSSEPATLGDPLEPINLRSELDRVERELIDRALRATDGDRKRAAELLGLPLRTLARKILTHGLG